MEIVSTAPSRISLFGGGSDLEPYFSKYGGVCINMAINLRQHVTMYSDPHLWNFNNGRGGKDIFPIFGDPKFCYHFLKKYGVDDGIHLTKLKNEFDGIIGTGIGSSAACAVTLLGALNKRLKLALNRQQIAELAWQIEVKELGLFGGKQDQYAAAFGGLRYYQFNKDGTVSGFAFSRLTTDLLAKYLVLVYTGRNRQGSQIQEKFRKLDKDQIGSLSGIKMMAEVACSHISKHEWSKVAKLLNDSWELKKESNHGVTNPEIDNFYNQGLKNGAMAGKIMGAGGTGFMVFMVEPDKRDYFIKKTTELPLEVWDFSPDYNGLEVRILPS